MRSSYPLEIQYVKLTRIEYIKPKSIRINSSHYYTLDWLKNHSMLKSYYKAYKEYYKRYCYV